MTTINERLDEMRARADAATEGPWFREFGDVVTGNPDPREPDWVEEPRSERVSHRAEHRDLRDEQGVADAAFIAAARTDLPRTVDALQAVMDEVADLRRAADENEPIAARGGWQASGYMKAYRRAADRLEAAIAGRMGVQP